MIPSFKLKVEGFTIFYCFHKSWDIPQEKGESPRGAIRRSIVGSDEGQSLKSTENLYLSNICTKKSWRPAYSLRRDAMRFTHKIFYRGGENAGLCSFWHRPGFFKNCCLKKRKEDLSLHFCSFIFFRQQDVNRLIYKQQQNYLANNRSGMQLILVCPLHGDCL